MVYRNVRLYLIRHGQSVANTKNHVCGGSETPLTERGIREAYELKTYLDRIQFSYSSNTRFYTSTLERARDTFRFIFPNIDDPIMDPRLNEMNVGEAAAITNEVFFKENPDILHHGLNPHIPYPKGENLHQFFNRTREWLDSVIAECTSNEVDKIVVVSHLGTMNCLLQTLFGVPLRQFPAFIVGNATLTEVTLKITDEGYWPVLTMYGLR